MREYASISPRFWIGDTGRKLRGNPEAQVLALYLMSNHHTNMIGVYHCTLGYMAEDTGLTLKKAQDALRDLVAAGFCEYEAETDTVFVIQMAKYQVGEDLHPGDKRLAGIKKSYRNIGSDHIRSRFFATYSVAYSLEQIGPPAAPATPSAPPLAESLPPPATPSPVEAPQDGGAMTAEEVIFHIGLPLLVSAQVPEKQARSFLGGLRKGAGDAVLVRAIHQCARERPLQPLDWLAKAAPIRRGAGKQSFGKTDYGKGVSNDGSLE